jgi:hypothetical protein
VVLPALILIILLILLPASRFVYTITTQVDWKKGEALPPTPTRIPTRVRIAAVIVYLVAFIGTLFWLLSPYIRTTFNLTGLSAGQLVFFSVLILGTCVVPCILAAIAYARLFRRNPRPAEPRSYESKAWNDYMNKFSETLSQWVVATIFITFGSGIVTLIILVILAACFHIV